MTTWSDLIASTRKTVLRDTATPYLWDDDQLLQFFAEAQVEMCQRTGLLVNRTYVFKTEAPISLTQGTGLYDMPATTVEVTSAIITGDHKGLIPFNAPMWELASYTVQGHPTGFCTNLDYLSLAFDYVPDAVYEVTCELLVIPDTSDPLLLTDEPDVQTQYLRYLPYYVAWQCMSQPDADMGNPQKATEYQGKWLTGLRDIKRQVYTYRARSTPDIPRIT